MEGKDFCEYWQMLCARFRGNDRKEELMQECVFIMWCLWKSRNEMVFKGILAKPMEMVNLVRGHILEFRAGQCNKRSEDGGATEGSVDSFAGLRVRWKRPPFGVMKINCDGAWCGKTCKGGYGWVLQDFAGLLQAAGGEGGLFFNSAAMAEAAAIRVALRVCCELDYADVELESDSQVLI